MKQYSHYKIVAVNDFRPEAPGVYLGEIPSSSMCADQHPIIQAISAQFGDGEEDDMGGLKGWSGGYVAEWIDDLRHEPETDEYMMLNGDTTFHIYVGDKAFNERQDWLVVVKLGPERVFVIRDMSREDAINEVENECDFVFEDDMDGDYVIISEIPVGGCVEITTPLDE